MRSRTGAGRRYLALGASGIVALTLAACGGDGDDPDPEDTGDGGTASGQLVFAGSAEPVVIDGAWVSDGESIRVIRQIFEGLVTTEAGGTDIIPALAASGPPVTTAWSGRSRSRATSRSTTASP